MLLKSFSQLSYEVAVIKGVVSCIEDEARVVGRTKDLLELFLRFSNGSFYASQCITVGTFYFPKLPIHAKVDVCLSCWCIFGKNLE